MPKIAAFDGKEVEYVEVHDEPIHRRQFSNDYVYIYIAGIRQVGGVPGVHVYPECSRTLLCTAVSGTAVYCCAA